MQTEGASQERESSQIQQVLALYSDLRKGSSQLSAVHLVKSLYHPHFLAVTHVRLTGKSSIGVEICVQGVTVTVFLATRCARPPRELLQRQRQRGWVNENPRVVEFLPSSEGCELYLRCIEGELQGVWCQ